MAQTKAAAKSVASQPVVAQKAVADFKRHAGDTGSTEVQIAAITERIKHLTNHFKTHAKDFGSKRGLLILVGQRRRLLKYLARQDEVKHKEVIESLGLRK